jgi:hypothetical protein
MLPKNMFGCPLELILKFSRIFRISSYKPKYSYTIIYECENSPLSHELSLVGLINFFSLNFVSSKICYLQKVNPQKSWSFFLFLEPKP